MNCNACLFILVFAAVSLPGWSQRPNILWITIEDTSPHFIGCYGNPHARTPTIDSLSTQGIRFTNAFSTGTVCSPSRTTLFTGVRTYALGAGHHRSAIRLPAEIKGFPLYLRQQGYHVSNNSKTDYNIEKEKAFIRETWDESSPDAGWWNRRPGQPFFSVVNFMESHQSRTMTHPYEWYVENVLEQLPEEERIADDAFPMPPFYKDTPEMRRQVARVYNSIKLTDDRIRKLLDRLVNDQLADSTIIFFFADHGQGIPRGKTNGINLGYRVPLIIWVPPIYRHLSPWGGGNGIVSHELVSFEDLGPTLISLAGGAVPQQMKGRILMGSGRSRSAAHLLLSSDRSDNGVDLVRTVTDGRYLYSRNFMPYMPEVRYIRYMEIGEIKQVMRKDLAAARLDELQRSLFDARPADFLFDLHHDPWETRNLAEDAAVHDVLVRMRGVLDSTIAGSRDVMFLPEYELQKINAQMPPYVFRQDTASYPLEKILRAASLSGYRGSEVASKQVRLLDSDNPVVRYWAITGLRAQPDEVLSVHRERLLRAQRDAYAPVSITASAIGYDVFGDKDGEAQLKARCQDQDMTLRLMAVNFLLYVRNPRPFIDTVRKLYMSQPPAYEVSGASKDFLGRLGLIPNNFDNR